MLTILPLHVESQVMVLDSQINMWRVKSELNHPFLTSWSSTDMNKVNLYKFASTPKDHTDIKNMNDNIHMGITLIWLVNVRN